MNQKSMYIGVGLVALAIGWYLFRPERIFVNATVNEGFPSTVAADSKAADSMEPVLIATGIFHNVAPGILAIPSDRKTREPEVSLDVPQFPRARHVAVLLAGIEMESDWLRVKDVDPPVIDPLRGEHQSRPLKG